MIGVFHICHLIFRFARKVSETELLNTMIIGRFPRRLSGQRAGRPV